MPKTTPTANPVSEAAIRDRAYHLWEAAGRPDGNADHFWHEAHHQATAELVARSSESTAKARKGKATTSGQQMIAKVPKSTKPKKVAEDTVKKPAKKTTKPRAAGLPTTH